MTTNSPNRFPSDIDPASSRFPSIEDLRELADAIARDGINAHRGDLAVVAEAAATTELYPGAVAVIREPSSPDAPRSRAFMVLARHWPEIVDASHRKGRFNRAFNTLACRWDRHRQLLHTTKPDLEGLWRSHNALEAARAEMHLLRTPR